MVPRNIGILPHDLTMSQPEDVDVNWTSHSYENTVLQWKVE